MCKKTKDIARPIILAKSEQPKMKVSVYADEQNPLKKQVQYLRVHSGDIFAILEELL